ADAAYQALRANQVDGGGNKKWLDAHVHQTANGFRSAVSVQRGKHQVSSERGLDGDFRGFEIANLADEDYVGVLAQKGAERSRKVQPDRFLHLHLVNAMQLELDRIFGRHDVGIGFVEQRNR